MAYQDDSFESFVKKQKPVDPPDDSFESFARRQEPQPKVKGPIGPAQRELHTGAPGQDSYNLAPPVPLKPNPKPLTRVRGPVMPPAPAPSFNVNPLAGIVPAETVRPIPAGSPSLRQMRRPAAGGSASQLLREGPIDVRAMANEEKVRAAMPPQLENERRTWAQAVGDSALQLGEGAVNIPGAIAGLVAPQSGIAQGLGRTAEAIRQKQSAPFLAKQQRVSQAIDQAGEDGVIAQFLESLSQSVSDPAIASQIVMSNLPMMIPGLGSAKLAQVAALARGATAVRAAQIAATTAGVSNAILNAGDARKDAFEEVKKDAIRSGQSEADATNTALLRSLPSAAVGGAAGWLSGRTGLENRLFSKTAGNALKQRGAAALAELGGEEAEEVLPLMTTNLAANKPLTANVGRTAAETMIATAPSSALAGSISGEGSAEGRISAQVESRKKGHLDGPTAPTATPAPFGFRPTNKQPTSVIPLGAPRSPQATQTAATQADFSKRMAELPESDRATLEFQTAIAEAQKIPDPIRRAQAIANIRVQADATELLGVDRGTPIQDRLAQTGINRPGPNLSDIRAENLDFVPPGRQPQIDALNKEIEREGQFKAKEEKLNRLNADLAFEGQKRAREIENQKLTETLRALQEADKANRQRAKEGPKAPAAPKSPAAPPSSPLMESITNPEGGVPFAPEIKASPGAMFERVPFTETQEDIPDVLKTIRKYGGVKDDGIHTGEIRNLLGNRETGTTGLINKNGLSPDRMREALVEDGLLPPDSTTADFFDLINNSQSRRTAQSQTYTSFDDFYSNQPEVSKFGAQRGPKSRTGVPIPGRKAIVEPVQAEAAPEPAQPMSRYKQLQRAAETTFPDFWDAPVTAERRKALLEYGSEYDVDNLISEAQNYQVREARRQDAIQKAGKSAFEKENAAADPEIRLTREVQKLDNFFNDLESDTDLADEFDKAINGENPAGFAKILDQMYGIPEETTNELIEARRGPEYGQFAKEHESTAEETTARSTRAAEVNAPAPAEPTISNEERGKLDKLLAFDPTGITPANIDKYIGALDNWSNRRITKGDVPEEAIKQIIDRQKQAKVIRKEMNRRGEIGPMFPSRTLTKAQVEEKLQKERDKKAAEATPEVAPEVAKPAEPAQVQFMITRDMRQQLADLGYSKADVNAMEPQEAAGVIAAGTTKTAAKPSPAETPSRTVSEETKPIAGEKDTKALEITRQETWDDGTVVEFAKSPFPKIPRRVELPREVDIARAKVIDVPLGDLYGTQLEITRNGIEKARDDSFGLPLVIQSNGIRYIQDGHHRLATDAIAGKTSAKVRFVDLDATPIAEAIRSAVPDKSDTASVKTLREKGYSDDEIIQAVKDSNYEFRLSRDNRSETAIKASGEKDTSGEPLIKMNGEYYVPWITVVKDSSPEAAPAQAPETASVPGGEITKTEQKILDLLDPAKSPKGAAYGWMEARTGKGFADAIKGLVDSGKVRQVGSQYYRADAPETKTEKKSDARKEIKALTDGQTAEYERRMMAGQTHEEAIKGAREKEPEPKFEAPNVSLKDLPLDLATRAHNGTSWTPEVRGKSEQQEYVRHMESVWKRLLERAKTDEQKATAETEFERYRQGWLTRYKTLLSSRSNIVSAFIAGPSKFPARQMNKRGDAYQNRVGEFLEWDKRAQKAMREAVAPTPPRSISADRADATEELQKKIDKAERLQGLMKSANAIVRKKSLTDDQKVEQMVAAGLSEGVARNALTPDYAGRFGFPDYEIKNNNANIRRMKERIAEIEATRAMPAGSAEFEGGSIEENEKNNRIQVFFDEKPPAEVREKLKSRGFKWAPSEGAWQRQRTANARAAVEEIFGLKLKSEPESVQPEAATEDEGIEFKPLPDETGVIDDIDTAKQDDRNKESLASVRAPKPPTYKPLPAPVFFSAAERFVQNPKFPEKGSGAQMLATITNPQSGVKADEVKWLGLEDWLRPKQSVTRQELLDFIRANEVQIEEVKKGKRTQRTSDHEKASKAFRAGATVRWINTNPGSAQTIDVYDDISITDSRSALKEDVDNGSAVWEIFQGGEPDTKHSKWVEPGAKEGSYRELLLTMPSRLTDAKKTNLTAEQSARALAERDGENWNDLGPNARQRYYAAATQNRLAEIGDFYNKNHFDEANILAHIRFNERTDADGKRTMFVEEIQSDWAQAGRRQGFKKEPLTELPEGYNIKKNGDFYYVVKNADNQVLESDLTKEGAVRRALALLNQRADQLAVPAMPFPKTESWAMLAFKRVLRHAAENGYDQVAWTTGKQQEERYWGHELVRPAVQRWDEISQPKDAGEQLLHYFGRELASVTPLEIVDTAMLPALQNDQVRGAVIKAIPVDVVNVLSENGVSPDQLVSQPDVIGSALPVNVRPTVSRGLASALHLVGTRLRTALNRTLTTEATGRDEEVLPAVRTSDLDTDVVMGFLSRPSPADFLPDIGTSRRGGSSTGDRAESPMPALNGNLTGEAPKLSTAQLAEALNRHAAIIAHRTGKPIEDLLVQPPPGAGMKGFYDAILPSAVNKYIKKWGGKVGETRIKDIRPIRPYAVQPENDTFRVFDLKSEEYVGERYPTFNEAAKESERLNDIARSAPVHSIDITSAMKESVLQGQPMFAVNPWKTPKATKPTSASDQAAIGGNIRAEFRQRGQQRQGVVWINEQAGIAISAAMKRSGAAMSDGYRFEGVSMPFETANALVDDLRERAEWYKGLDLLKDAERDASVKEFNGLADQIEEAIFDAQANDAGGVAIVDVTVPNASKVAREELFHNWQRKVSAMGAGDSIIRRMPKAAQDIYNQKIRPRLLKEGYTEFEEGDTLRRNSREWVLVTEAAAKMASGQATSYGVSESEAVDFISGYFETVARIFGIDALNNIDGLNYAAKQAAENVRQRQGGAISEGRSGGIRPRAENTGRGSREDAALASIGRRLSSSAPVSGQASGEKSGERGAPRSEGEPGAGKGGGGVKPPKAPRVKKEKPAPVPAEIKRDVKPSDYLRSPLSNLNFVGTYERLAGDVGKQVSELFRESQERIAKDKTSRQDAIKDLRKNLRPLKDQIRAGGSPGLARWIDAHVDALQDPDEAFRGLAGFLKEFNYVTKLQYNPRSTLMNVLQPLQTLWPHFTTREFFDLAKQAYSPSVRNRLEDIAARESGGKVEDVQKEGRSKYNPLSWDMFGAASANNRIMGHLAGEKIADRLGVTGEAKDRMAADWAQKVEFDNSRYNVPPLFRGTIAGVLGQFKPYTIKNIERIIADFKAGPKGATSGDLARRSKMVFSQVLLGGLRSIPGFKSIGGILLLGALAKAFSKAGFDDDDANKWAEAVYFGAPSLIDQDLSGSMGILDEPFGDTPAEKIVNFAGGPTVSGLAKIWKESQYLYDTANKKETGKEKLTKEERLIKSGVRLFKGITPYTKTAQTGYALAHGEKPVMNLRGAKVEMTNMETAGYGLMGTPKRQTLHYDIEDAYDWQKKSLKAIGVNVASVAKTDAEAPPSRKAGEPDDLYKARTGKIAEWKKTYTDKLESFPRYQALTDDEKQKAQDSLNRRILERSNRSRPDMKGLEPGKILIDMKKNAAIQARKNSKMIYVPEQK